MRPTIYSKELSEEICERIAGGDSLRKICAEENMPSIRAIMNWLSKYPQFVQQYALAREVWAEAEFERMMEIVDDGTNDTYEDEEGNVKTDYDVIARSKLRFEARKWALEKHAAKKYGLKQVIDLNTAETAMANLSEAERIKMVEGYINDAKKRLEEEEANANSADDPFDGSDLV